MGLILMPFGNSGAAESSDFKVQWTRDRCVVQETRPTAHRLAHGSWTAARTPLGGDAAAQGVVDPAQELIFLVVRNQIVEEAQHEPHRLHQC